MTNKPMKRCLAALILSKMQLKTQSDTTTHLTKWLKIERLMISNDEEIIPNVDAE